MTENEKKKMYIVLISIASIFISFIFLYISFLLSGVSIFDYKEDKQKESIDIYNMNLQQDIGISGSDYNDRDLYSDEQFEIDKKEFVSWIKASRYDLISGKARHILASYRFNDAKLSSISKLEQIEGFDKEETSSDQRIILVSGIQDIELYLQLFMKLSRFEQAQLIEFDNVKMVPYLNYDNITVEKKNCGIHDPEYSIINKNEFYQVTLESNGFSLIVKLIRDNSLKIFYVDNIDGTMESYKY